MGTITLHQPFLISSGLSGGGIDVKARDDARIPASAIKGVMRASAEQILRLDVALVEAVFGVPGTHGAWAWTHAGDDEDFQVGQRTRNRLDDISHTTVPEALATMEEVYANRPVSFLIEPIGATEPSHRTLLVAAAWAVTSIGSGRNRAMGTATIRIDDHDYSPDDLATFVMQSRRRT